MNTTNNTNVTSAMLIMVLAMLLVPGMDAIAKWLATQFSVSPATIAFVRFLVQSLLLFTLVAMRTRSVHITARKPAFNILRGLLMAAASMIFFISVKYMPIADAISIFFVEPIFVMFLSWIFLGETIGWRRVVAAFVGFLGAMLVIQPSFELFGLISLLPLCTAILYSFYLILTRKYGVEDSPMNMQFYAGIGGVIFGAIVLAIGEGMQVPDLMITIPKDFASVFWLVVIGILATVSHLLIVIAFTKAAASTLAPFQYIEIVSATILGLLIFGDFPNLSKWIGTGIIIASGLYIFWREQQIDKASKQT